MTHRSMLDRAAFPILVVAGAERERLAGETLHRIVAELGALGHEIVRSTTASDATALVTSDPSFGCLIVDWNLDHESGKRPAEALLDRACRHNVRVPVFLMIEREDLEEVPLRVEEMVQEYVLVFEDTPSFVAGRIDYAWRRHTENLLPPFFREAWWLSPSHTSTRGTRPVMPGGRHSASHRWARPSTTSTARPCSAPTSQSRSRSSAPCSIIQGWSEKRRRTPAGVFGAEATYFVLNGTSTSNQIVAHACVVAGDVVLADRNCHKSVNHALTVTDAIPVYLMPSRNGYGIIGPIPPAGLSDLAIGDSGGRKPTDSRGYGEDAGVRRRHQLDL